MRDLFKGIGKHKMLTALLCFVMVFALGYIIYSEYVEKSKSVIEPINTTVEVEINSDFDYDITKYIKVNHRNPDEVFSNMISTIENVKTDEINEFYVVVRYENEKKGFWVNVVDTKAPICLTRRAITYTTDQTWNIMDLVYDYEDASPVKFYVLNEPNFQLDFIGEKEIAVVCEDNSGNRTYNAEILVRVEQGQGYANVGGNTATTSTTKLKMVTAPPKTTTNVNQMTTTTRIHVSAPAEITTTKPAIISPENTIKQTTTSKPIAITTSSRVSVYLLDKFAFSKPMNIPVNSNFQVKEKIQNIINNENVYPTYVSGFVDSSKVGLYEVVYGITYNGVYSETIAQYQVYQPIKPDPSTLYLWDSTYGDKSCKWSVKETCKTIVLKGDMDIPKLKIEGASSDPNGVRLQYINSSYTTAGTQGRSFYVIWNYNGEILGEIKVEVDMQWN